MQARFQAPLIFVYNIIVWPSYLEEYLVTRSWNITDFGAYARLLIDRNKMDYAVCSIHNSLVAIKLNYPFFFLAHITGQKFFEWP